MANQTLTLEPESGGLNYDALLREAAHADVERQLQHVSIRVPQENVNMGDDFDSGIFDSDPVQEIKLSGDAVETFLQSANLKTFKANVDECCEAFTHKAFNGGRALAPLGKMGNLVALRLVHPIFANVEILTEHVLNPNLRELTLKYMMFGSPTGPRSWSRQECKTLVHAISKLTNLVKLNLSDCYLRDEDLDKLLLNLPNLRVLDLSGGFGDMRENTEWISDFGLRKIANHCPNLDALYLNYQRKPTMVGVKNILCTCTNLRDFDIGIHLTDGLVPLVAPVFAESSSLVLLTVDAFAPNGLAQQVATLTGGQTIVKSVFQGLIDVQLTAAQKTVRERNIKLIEECWKRLEDSCIINEWEYFVEAPASSSSGLAPASTSTSSLAPMSCSWIGCPSGGTDVDLQACSRCKEAAYCSKSCQKKHWGVHKHKCAALDVPRHEVKHMTIAAVQKAIDEAKPGDIVLLRDGKYTGSGSKTELIIDKPLSIWGTHMDKSDLDCDNIIVKSSSSGRDSKGIIVLTDFQVSGTVLIEKNCYKSITFCKTKIQCPNGRERDDALTIEECDGKCLLLDCEVYGGSDGIRIRTAGVHLKRSEITFAQHRGIFADRPFVIEDTEVSNCGGYGIKGRSGWTEKGRSNDIQPGPWQACGPSGFVF